METPNTLYVLEWTCQLANGKEEHRHEVFTWEQRQDFIKRVIKLRDMDSWWASDIKTFIARPQPLDVESLLD